MAADGGKICHLTINRPKPSSIKTELLNKKQQERFIT